MRGGIVDVFPPTSPWPVRLEFFGDELESLFRPTTRVMFLESPGSLTFEMQVEIRPEITLEPLLDAFQLLLDLGGEHGGACLPASRQPGKPPGRPAFPGRRRPGMMAPPWENGSSSGAAWSRSWSDF